jgi:hypothetical protein
VVGSYLAHVRNRERVVVEGDVHVGLVLIGIHRRIGICGVGHSKVGSHEWITSPVKKACGKSMVLSDREPFPLVLRRNPDVRWSMPLELPENDTLVLLEAAPLD